MFLRLQLGYGEQVVELFKLWCLASRARFPTTSAMKIAGSQRPPSLGGSPAGNPCRRGANTVFRLVPPFWGSGLQPNGLTKSAPAN